MNYCGDETGDLTTSPGSRWVCGVFYDHPSSRLVMTDRRGLVLLWTVGEVSHLAVSDAGVVAAKEFGSGIHCRVRVFFPDGATAQPRSKNLDSITGLMLSADSSVLELAREGQPVESIQIGGLYLKPGPKAVIHRKRPISLGLHFILTVISLGLWIPLWMLIRPTKP